MINEHIRSDTHNQLMLRAEMRQSDIDVVRDTGKGKVDREAVRLLKAKVDRDPAYRLIIFPFGFPH